MKRFQWAALLTVLVVMAAVPSVAFTDTEQAEKGAKGFWVEKAHIDMDPVAAGTDAVATYVFHNDTDKEVKIIKAKPS
ncbi:MAG: hypothetical protein KAJ78_04410 [Acidobacteria bacterium]|nr:hypothetical protein [Acidobacteriota bacterium]